MNASRRKSRFGRRKSEEGGFALLLVFVLAATVAIYLYMQLPRAAFESQRLKEELLMERGHEYQRAIQLYFRKFKHYPQKIEDLENTNDIRFLRHRYKDPMTGKDDWRIIHMGPGGYLADSLVDKPPTAIAGDKAKDGLGGTASPTGPDSNTPQQLAQAAGQAQGPQPVNNALVRRPSDIAASAIGTQGAVKPQDPNQPYDPNQPQQNGQPAYPGAPAAPPYGAQPYNPNQTGQPYNPAQQQYNPNQPYNLNQASQYQNQQYQNQQYQNQQYQNQQYGTPSYPGAAAPYRTQPQPYNPNQPYNTTQSYNPNQAPNPNQTYNPAAPPPYVPGQVAPVQPYPGAPVNSQMGGMSGQQPFGAQTQPVPAGSQQPGGGSLIPGVGSGQNAALGLINQILTSPRQPPAGIGTGTGLEVQGGIAGVASKDEDVGIMRYRDHDKYKEWEFVYDFKKDKTLGAVGGMGAGVGQQNPVGAAGTGTGTASGTGQSGFGQSSFGQSSFGQSSFGQSGAQSNNGFTIGTQQQTPQQPSPQQ